MVGTALLRQVRWGQVLFGALVVLLAGDLYQRAVAGRMGEPGSALRVLGALVLVLGFAVYLNNQYRHGLLPDYARTCRYCLGPVNSYSEFCEHCGADLISPERLVACPHCDADNYEGVKFCPECGGNLKAKPKKGPRSKRKGGGGPPPKEGWDQPIDAVSGFPDDVR